MAAALREGEGTGREGSGCPAPSPPAGCGREGGRRERKGKEKRGAASATAGRAWAESGGAAGLARVEVMRAAARRHGGGCVPVFMSLSGEAWWRRGGKQGSRFPLGTSYCR